MNKKTMAINDLKKILEILDPDKRTYYSSDGYPLVSYIEDCLKPFEKYGDIPQEDLIKKISEACGLQGDITINNIKENINAVKKVERKTISEAEQTERDKKQSAQETYKKSKKVQGDKTREKNNIKKQKNIKEQAIAKAREPVCKILLGIKSVVETWVDEIGKKKIRLEPIGKRKRICLISCAIGLISLAAIAIILTILDVTKNGCEFVGKYGAPIGAVIGCIDLVFGAIAFAVEILDDLKTKSILMACKVNSGKVEHSENSDKSNNFYLEVKRNKVTIEGSTFLF